MGNWETDAAWRYHDFTKHSLESLRSSVHHLDWSNRPRSHKLYKDLEPHALPQDLVLSGFPALSAISRVDVHCDGECIPDLRTLTSVLHYSVGITKWLKTAGGGMAFRAAACTGALYHIELYLVCGGLPDLEAGVYQFGAQDGALRRLRDGDFRGVLVEATAEDARIAEAPVTLVCTSTYWRNAWKYQSRTYRHCFWDSGTILANVLAIASAHDLPAQVVAGFVDSQVNRLLDTNDQKEVALFMVPLGYAPSMRSGPAPMVERLHLETAPLSKWEVDYPDIREMHHASSLDRPEEVLRWKASLLPPSPAALTGEIAPLKPPPSEAAPQDAIETIIKRRGSSRRFEQTSVSFDALSVILTAATCGIPSDFLASPGGALNDLYLIVNAVDGLDSGTYVYQRQRQALELLRAGDFRAEAGHLALDQELGAAAAVNVYFLADMGPILERFGNRGYRAAQLDASITGGRLYLAAYACGLGATGLTFFDDDVTTFFSPHAQGKSVMFLTALGVPAKRRSI